MRALFCKRLGGFTLIELLIVVAIIAILAAIAVPNFIEAQTRAKISRAKADMRSLATAIEAYCVDTNTYPPVNRSGSDPDVRTKYCYFLFFENEGSTRFLERPWLSTPIAYISSYPIQPFRPRAAVNQWNAGFRAQPSYYFVNFKGAAGDPGFLEARDLTLGPASTELLAPMPINTIGGGTMDGVKQYCNWVMFGLGPSGVQDLDTVDANQYGIGTSNVLMTFDDGGGYLRGWRNGWWPTYDPTNGTLSLGFIYRLSGGNN